MHVLVLVLLVILTEWNQFRALDMKKIKKLLKSPNIIDLRNIYNGRELRDFGLIIIH